MGAASHCFAVAVVALAAFHLASADGQEVAKTIRGSNVQQIKTQNKMWTTRLVVWV